MGIVTYTHGWSWLSRMVQLVVRLFVVVAVWTVLGFSASQLAIAFGVGLSVWVHVVLLLCGAVPATFYLEFKFIGPFIHTLSTYFYVNQTLGTEFSWDEARAFAWIFSPNEFGHWYPMKELKSVPKHLRRSHLFAAIESISAHRDRWRPQSIN